MVLQMTATYTGDCGIVMDSKIVLGGQYQMPLKQRESTKQCLGVSHKMAALAYAVIHQSHCVKYSERPIARKKLDPGEDCRSLRPREHSWGGNGGDCMGGLGHPNQHVSVLTNIQSSREFVVYIFSSLN